MYSVSISTRFTTNGFDRRRPRGPTPSPVQVQRVAVDAIYTLETAGVDACFVGGMACKLFGNPRQPNDLDILCLTDEWDQESLKRKLVALNSNFYLVPSRDPSATYKVLWYHILDTDSCLKVDLLFPGVLDIPAVPLSSIDRSNSANLPCAPLSVVLLLKLQGWIHHGEAISIRYQLKQPMDERDINALLPIARRLRLLPGTEDYLPASFLLRARSRVEKYVKRVPSSKDGWESLGFKIAKDKPIPPPKNGRKQRFTSSSEAHSGLRARHQFSF